MKLGDSGSVAQLRTHYPAGAEELRRSIQASQGTPIGGGSLDTLAHSGLFPSSASESQIAVITSSARDEEAKYQKRAKRKNVTKPLVTRLTDYAKVNGSHLEKSYRNSIYCSDKVIQEDSRLRSHYCKNRCCLVCEAIKTAKYIHMYGPEILSWDVPMFVTQTLRTVTAEELSGRLKHMQSEWDLVRRYSRRKGIETKAIRKLEITYNTKTKRYHPHYHFITSSLDFAEFIISNHLDRHRESASPSAQDIRPADKRSMVELFKYATKPVSSKRSGERQSVPLHALDTIYRSLYRKNVITKVGFKVEKEIDVEELEDLRGGVAFKSIETDIIWEWEQACSDWIDKSTGEVLSGYNPDEEESGASH